MSYQKKNILKHKNNNNKTTPNEHSSDYNETITRLSTKLFCFVKKKTTTNDQCNMFIDPFFKRSNHNST